MSSRRLTSSLLLLLAIVNGGCATLMDRGWSTADPPATVGSFRTGMYRDLFATYLGKSQKQVDAKLERAWQQLFYGTDDNERVYFPVGSHSAYVEDIGNGDVRSEGMSYGMMIAVQLDKQEEFDRLWHWARTHMYHPDGPRRGYFAWQCSADGLHLDPNSASDGEEWLAMALLFAAGRWGNGVGIYDYEAEAKAILRTMLHKSTESQDIVTDMFDPEHRLVVFVPEAGIASSFTDPSYHVPHFYELWSRWAGRDQDFWSAAVEASRSFLRATAHPRTGLMPDYSRFDGTPIDPWESGHDAFRFDAWRVGMNVAADYTWFAADPWQVEQSNRWIEFFAEQGLGSYVNQYTLDGQPLSEEGSLGLVAMNAVAAMAATVDEAPRFVKALWKLEPPTGKWRYYDGMLYMLSLLHVSGRFQIYPPPGAADR